MSIAPGGRWADCSAVARGIGAACAGALLVLLAAVAQAQSAGVVEAFGKDVDAQVDRHYRQLESLYKDIHANPELAFEEINTAKKLARELRDLGFEVTEGLGKTGVVGLLREWRGADDPGAYGARCVADGGEDRSPLRKQGQDYLLGQGNARRAHVRP